MKNRGLVVFVALFVFGVLFSACANENSKDVSDDTISVKDLANGEYQILSGIKFYDRNLQTIESKITYAPSESFVGKNALFLYVSGAALGFGDKSFERKDFIEIIDKCIEWSNLAKENGVHALTREVKTEVTVIGATYRLEPFIVDFIFSVREINRKEETILTVNYKTTDQQNAYNFSNRSTTQGGFIVFKEQDFNNLKKIFSEDLLAQIDKMDEEKKEKEQLFQ